VAELKPIGLGGFPHGKLSNSRPKWSHSTVAGSSRPVGYWYLTMMNRRAAKQRRPHPALVGP